MTRFDQGRLGMRLSEGQSGDREVAEGMRESRNAEAKTQETKGRTKNQGGGRIGSTLGSVVVDSGRAFGSS
jgi:hypothetical protein